MDSKKSPKQIFISYRRQDEPWAAYLLYRYLTSKSFPTFMDRVSIEGGKDFWNEIQKSMLNSFVCIVIIGPKWAEITRKKSKNSEVDYALEEISFAYKSGIKVISVLVSEDNNTVIDCELPVSIDDLKRLNHIQLSLKHLEPDLEEIVKAVTTEASEQNIKLREQRVSPYAISALLIGCLALFLLTHIYDLNFQSNHQSATIQKINNFTTRNGRLAKVFRVGSKNKASLNFKELQTLVYTLKVDNRDDQNLQHLDEIINHHEVLESLNPRQIHKTCKNTIHTYQKSLLAIIDKISEPLKDAIQEDYSKFNKICNEAIECSRDDRRLEISGPINLIEPSLWSRYWHGIEPLFKKIEECQQLAELIIESKNGTKKTYRSKLNKTVHNTHFLIKEEVQLFIECGDEKTPIALGDEISNQEAIYNAFKKDSRIQFEPEQEPISIPSGCTK